MYNTVFLNLLTMHLVYSIALHSFLTKISLAQCTANKRKEALKEDCCYSFDALANN